MRIYKYNKNGIKITVKIDIPEEITTSGLVDPNFHETLDFEYLGDPYQLYYDDSRYCYPSFLTYLNYDLHDLSLTYDMLQHYKPIKF